MTQLNFTKTDTGKFEATFISEENNMLQLGVKGSFLMLHVYVRFDESLEWANVSSSPIGENFLAKVDIPKETFVRLVVDADSIEYAYLK